VPATLATETIDIDGLRTRQLVRGEGSQSVLVLHGWGASIEAVQSIVTGLAPLARVYALDLPGFGESDPPPQPWGVQEYQEFVASYMDRAGVGRATIVAHSNGGRIAIRMAATEPRRVRRLVLVDAAGIRPKRTLRWYRRVAMAKLGKHAARLLGRPGERLRDALVSRAASADYAAAGALRPTLVRLVNSDLREQMPRIAAPTLLIWGSEDADTPLAMAREMERLIPDAGLVVLEGAGHFSYADQPARFARIVGHFVAGPPPAAGAPGAVAPALGGEQGHDAGSGTQDHGGAAGGGGRADAGGGEGA
jgi:pimeloyl-ACP methyl ester carboxylesterase